MGLSLFIPTFCVQWWWWEKQAKKKKSGEYYNGMVFEFRKNSCMEDKGDRRHFAMEAQLE